jgi:Family of unknown function (DUF6464)
MNQIERVEGDVYTLRLWSDAVYEVSTSAIKSLLNLATQRLEIQLEIDAYYHHIIRNWRVRFSWCLELSGRQSFEQNLDHSQVVCANPMFLERLAFDMGDRIRRIMAPDDSQSWDIVRWREEFFAKIHQREKRSINLILYEVTQEGDLTTSHTTVTIRARIPSDAIRRHDGVEIGGMLLQGELLGWVEEAGLEGWFLFSPNTQQVNTSPSLPNETRITFTTRPRTNRLASFERISQMLEQGQIELPRSGYFDQYLMDYPDRPERVSLEIPRQYQFIESYGESFQLLSGRFEVDREAIVLPRVNAINAIGDTTCQYNARSRMIRCAVNPCGPCEGCKDYEKI